MAIEVKHKFQSATPDEGDATRIRPSDWNDLHDFTVVGKVLVGKPTAATGAASEIALGTGLSWEGASIKVTSVAGWTEAQLNAYFASKINKSGDIATGQILMTKAARQMQLHYPDVETWGTEVNSNGSIVFQTGAGNRIAFGVSGDMWTASWGDTNERIEKRTKEYANARVETLGYRQVSRFTLGRGDQRCPNGAIVTGFSSGLDYGEMFHFYGRYLQVWDHVRGWVGFQNA